jgi:hypothetical protein
VCECLKCHGNTIISWLYEPDQRGVKNWLCSNAPLPATFLVHGGGLFFEKEINISFLNEGRCLFFIQRISKETGLGIICNDIFRYFAEPSTLLLELLFTLVKKNEMKWRLLPFRWQTSTLFASHEFSYIKTNTSMLW